MVEQPSIAHLHSVPFGNGHSQQHGQVDMRCLRNGGRYICVYVITIHHKIDQASRYFTYEALPVFLAYTVKHLEGPGRRLCQVTFLFPVHSYHGYIKILSRVADTTLNVKEVPEYNISIKRGGTCILRNSIILSLSNTSVVLR